ncbi:MULTISPECIES: sulfurtransferase complex subunit TusB [Vibrio]|uniref:sulfurtransferase complex subunit TusB n=1 Tax=Vibrio TaxID=662 RepID=UPI00093354EF|nr:MULTISPECIES: sulfurtransferase complex subunit TusB [Vibrio]PXA66534.1 sulfurtransferase complex subunit TusB [Vibrio sp. 11986-1-5]
MLHIIKHPQQLKLVRRYFQAHDRLLLIENAVYLTSPQSPYFSDLQAIESVYALREDLLARGWLEKCSSSIEQITMNDFVEMTVSEEKSISWC